MTTSDWQQLHENLEIEYPRKRVPATKPTPQDIASFEETRQLRLPPDFSSFACVFGPGLQGDYFRFCVPNPGESWVEGDLGEEIDRFSKARETLAEIYEDQPLIDAAVPFANTIAGDVIVWDTRVTTRDPLEYAIVLLPRDSYAAIPLAETFASLFTEICQTGKFFDFLDSEPFTPPETFVVFGQK